MLGDLLSLLNPKNWFEQHPAQAHLGRDRVIDTFLKHVSADAEGLSTTITITATSRDAAKAALIANTLADVYVKSQVAAKVGATAATTGWLNNRLQDLAQQLQNPARGRAALQGRAQSQRLRARQLAGRSADGRDQRPDRAARSELAEKQAIKDRINQLVATGNPADVDARSSPRR